VIFSHRVFVTERPLSDDAPPFLSSLSFLYKTTSRAKTNTYIHINYAAKIRSKRRHRSLSSCHRW
jgi:hypothetical protein